jgi:hypothetical protein
VRCVANFEIYIPEPDDGPATLDLPRLLLPVKVRKLRFLDDADVILLRASAYRIVAYITENVNLPKNGYQIPNNCRQMHRN